MVLEDAAVPSVRENAQLCFRQPTRELNEMNDGTITSSSPLTTWTGCWIVPSVVASPCSLVWTAAI
jgi:hypothetical protein